MEDHTLEKVCLHDEMASDFNFENSCEIIFFSGNFSWPLGKCVEGFQGFAQGNGIGKRNLEEDCWRSVMKKGCMKGVDMAQIYSSLWLNFEEKYGMKFGVVFSGMLWHSMKKCI